MKNRFTRRQALACTVAIVAGGAIPHAAALANAGPSGETRPDELRIALLAWTAAARDESKALHAYNEMIGLDDLDPAVFARRVRQAIFGRRWDNMTARRTPFAQQSPATRAGLCNSCAVTRNVTRERKKT